MLTPFKGGDIAIPRPTPAAAARAGDRAEGPLVAPSLCVVAGLSGTVPIELPFGCPGPYPNGLPRELCTLCEYPCVVVVFVFVPGYECWLFWLWLCVRECIMGMGIPGANGEGF